MAFSWTVQRGTQLQTYTVAAANTAITNTGAFVLVATITNRGASRLRLTGTVGAAALTGFKITQSPTHGGTHRTVAEDAGFNTATATVREATANLYQTGAAGVFGLELDITSMAEVKVYAKAGGTTSCAMELAAQ